MLARDTESFVALILNDGWLVRHYARGGRMRPTSTMALRRRQAIHKLGLTVREAFNLSDDFEALLAAVVDALRPRDESPPF